MVIVQSEAPTFRLIARNNDSLSRRGRKWFFGSIAAVSLGIALGWAARGAWYVVPFAVVELVVLFVALRLIERHAADFESISISGDRVLMERHESGRVSRHEFNRCWAQLVVRRVGPGQRYDLSMRSHGREVSFGSFLTDEQRLEVAATLRKRLKND